MEAQHSVRDTDTEISGGLGVPVDLGYCSTDGVRVLKDHHSLRRDAFRRKFWLLAIEILLKEIDFIVLLDSFLSTYCKVLGGLRETESGVSVKFLLIFGNISWLGVVELLRPTCKILNYFISRDRKKLTAALINRANDSCVCFVLKFDLPPTTCFIPLL